MENFKGTKWGLILAKSDYTTHVPLKDEKQRERHFAKTVVTADKLFDKAYGLLNALDLTICFIKKIPVSAGIFCVFFGNGPF